MQSGFLTPSLKKIILTFIVMEVFAILLFSVFGLFLVQGSGAMEPAYLIGDIVFYKKAAYDEIQVGDVVVHQYAFEHPPRQENIIMRVVSKNEEERTYTTKGDNNREILPNQKNLPGESLSGKAGLRIPLLGYLAFLNIWGFFNLLNVSMVIAFYIIACKLSGKIRLRKKQGKN